VLTFLELFNNWKIKSTGKSSDKHTGKYILVLALLHLENDQMAALVLL